MLTHARAGRALAGSCFWSLAAAGFPDDGYKVNLLQQQRTPDLTSSSQPGDAAARSSTSGKADGHRGHGDRGHGEAAQPGRRAVTDGASTGEALDAQTHAELGAATGEGAGAQAPPPPDQADSSQRGMWRVSSAAQEQCEAATAMFDATTPEQAQRDACEQDALTVALIRRHARQVMALNAPAAASRECQLM